MKDGSGCGGAEAKKLADLPRKDPKEAPREGERDPKKPDGRRPLPDGDATKPNDDDTPAWALELPPESRRSALNADPEKIPTKYRELLVRYQKWLLERAAQARDGR